MATTGPVQDTRSLAEVHSTVGTSQVSFWKRMLAFAGPAYLVSVGYMDPGNWATDIEAGARFGYRLLWAKPSPAEMFTGLIPTLDGSTLYLAVTMLGATVMPHNMYLHSALVQTRNIGQTESAKRTACRFNLIDSVVALNGALLVNAAILVMSAAVFFKRGLVVTDIKDAHLLLAPLMGTIMAGVMFAVALLCSGQSSTLTGTMAGQVVMEGFLNFRMRPWLRRLITRSLAVLPAARRIYFAGQGSTLGL